MDRVDSQILERLMKNPTEPFLKIAKTIGISPVTVQKRYEKMKNKAFSPPFIIIDLSKIGYQGKAHLLISSTGSNPELTLKVLHNIPNVFLIAETIGKFDFIAFVAFRNIIELKKIVKQVRQQPSVKKVKIAITEQTDFPTRREYSASN
jgi:DNA-binding Lrp family transcriptional regulator